MYKQFFVLMLMFATASSGFGTEMCDPLLLVSDKNQKSVLFPKRLRFSTDSLYAGNSRGLERLNFIGSGAFTEEQLERITADKDIVVIVDLREESHGFINGEPVCWYQGMNSANEGKSTEEVELGENEALATVIPGEHIPIAEISRKLCGVINEYQWHFPLVKNVMTEQELVEKKGLYYQRFYVTNHKQPSDCEVDNFLEFVSMLPSDAWVYFHCRAGAGRTTTFMVMYDILRNGHAVPLEDIIERHIALGGQDLFTLPSQESYKYHFAMERKKFIKSFYIFVASGAIYDKKWSDWATSTL